MADEESISAVEELFYEGTDHHAEGNSDAALDCFERCLALEPDYADAILGKAMIALSRDQFDQAIALGKRLVELNPDDILAHTNLSVFYQRAGLITEAEDAGARARTLDWKRQLADDD